MIRTSVETITPALAETLLAKRDHNPRKTVIWSSVNRLVEMHKRGEWQEQHPNPISLDDAGNLLDGQHRLFMVKTLGVPVKMTVARGVSQSTVPYIDTGKSRLLNDRVCLDPDPNLNRTLTQLLQCEAKLRSGNNTPLSAADILPRMDAMGEHYLWAAQTRRKGKVGVGRAVVLVAGAELHARNRKAAVDFLYALQDGTGLIQQTVPLREFLIRTTSTTGVGAMRESYDKCVYCMQQYLDESEVTKVIRGRWREDI